jgi:5-methylcytosine-specific restriction endonuclease McrA
MRLHRSPTEKLRIFERLGGVCHLCGSKIQAGQRWDLEHVVALAIGGEDNDENLGVAHRKCHAAKTVADIARIAKAKRVRQKHFGARRDSKWPCSRDSAWKKKLSGEVVRR